MKKRLRRLLGQESGSLAAVVGVMLTALMGLTALGTDVGRLYLERQRLSVVADAAALSGAQYLPENPDTARQATGEYLLKNGVNPDTAAISLTEDGRRVNVSMSRTVPMTFARFVGVDEANVFGEASAKVFTLSGYSGAAPLGVPKADWQIGSQVSLKLGALDGATTTGNYQALALGKDGAASFEQNMRYGYPGWIRAGDWIDTETGNMANPTVRAVSYRIEQDPYATYLSYSRRSPRLVVVPILESMNLNGKGQVEVIGFGVFFLEAGVDKGAEKGEIVGRFLRFVIEGEGITAETNYGVFVTKLVN